MDKSLNTLKYTYLLIFFAGFIIAGSSCSNESPDIQNQLLGKDWEYIAEESEGTTVNFMMWQGSPVINNYINNYLIPEVRKRFNIDLRISGGQGAEIVQLVMGEKQAGISNGEIDMVWINGETFFQLRKIKGLWGPFVDKLPNAQYIDFEDQYINTDFQQPVNYMECPWSIGQFAMVYDTSKIVSPPSNLRELASYVRKYPGTFTISNDFTGMTLLKSFLAELGGGTNSLNGPFNAEKYDDLSSQLWHYINSNKQYFWKKGTTFPKEQSKVSQLFANGELYIDYGFGEGGIEEKVKSGLYPKSTRVYPRDNGTIKNTNYLGILSNSPNKAGAMQVINFMISPEAQFEKSHADGMDANPVIDINRLPVEWQDSFNSASGRKYGPALRDLENYAFPEPAPEYMIRLYDDFRKKVIEN